MTKFNFNLVRKDVFKNIFFVTAIVLTILPGIVMFSSLLTSIFNHFGWYKWLQEVVVPYESRLVAVLVKPLGITGKVVVPSTNVNLILIKPNGSLLPLRLEWNCLGWQSLILLGLTLIIGLRGQYKLVSKVETIILGVVGTFLSNIFRITLIALLAYYISDKMALVTHDYFAMLIALLWIVFFWWFAFNFVLEENQEK